MKRTDVDEPRARRTIFAALRRSANDLWGTDGLLRIGDAMSVEARRRCIDALVIEEEMLPERFVLEWYESVWAGPAERDKATYLGFLDRMMDHGFGRVRKLLLAMATPTVLAQKSSELWRHDHTHGELSWRPLTDRSIELTLTDHPYVETPLGRSSIAEIYRYAVSLTRVKHVTEKHWLGASGTLVVTLHWS